MFTVICWKMYKGEYTQKVAYEKVFNDAAAVMRFLKKVRAVRVRDNAYRNMNNLYEVIDMTAD